MHYHSSFHGEYLSAPAGDIGEPNGYREQLRNRGGPNGWSEFVHCFCAEHAHGWRAGSGEYQGGPAGLRDGDCLQQGLVLGRPEQPVYSLLQHWQRAAVCGRGEQRHCLHTRRLHHGCSALQGEPVRILHQERVVDDPTEFPCNPGSVSDSLQTSMCGSIWIYRHGRDDCVPSRRRTACVRWWGVGVHESSD